MFPRRLCVGLVEIDRKPQRRGHPRIVRVDLRGGNRSADSRASEKRGAGGVRMVERDLNVPGAGIIHHRKAHSNQWLEGRWDK